MTETNALILGLAGALIGGLPAIIMAIKGQGDHKENAANIQAAAKTAENALAQSATALLHTQPGGTALQQIEKTAVGALAGEVTKDLLQTQGPAPD